MAEKLQPGDVVRFSQSPGITTIGKVVEVSEDGMEVKFVMDDFSCAQIDGYSIRGEDA